MPLVAFLLQCIPALCCFSVMLHNVLHLGACRPSQIRPWLQWYNTRHVIGPIMFIIITNELVDLLARFGIMSNFSLMMLSCIQI